jgi:hypothetical protein
MLTSVMDITKQNYSSCALLQKSVICEICRLKVFENGVLRGIFGPKRDEATGDWRKLHKEELHNFYSSRNTIRMIKSRRMRWTGHVARMGRRGMHIGFRWEGEKERDH